MSGLMQVREVALQYTGDPITVPKSLVQSPAAVAKLFAGVIDREPVERFACLHLDGRQRCTGLEIISRGTLTASLVHPREVFRAAIMGGAAAIILAHNHPSGDPSPSSEDREITLRLVKAGEIIGIRVLDHVIVAGDQWESAQEEGWINDPA